MNRPEDGGVVLALDLGGTALAAGVVGIAGTILTQRVVPAARRGRGDGILQNLCETVSDLRDEALQSGQPIRGIGLGLPGIIDTRTGSVGEDIQNLPELRGLPVRRILEERFGLPVAVDNDVNALALAEWFFGAGRDCRSLAVIAAGTGVGGGLILNGALVRGAGGYGGEIGHIPVDLDGRECFCGSRGCVKAYASGPDIADQARALAGRGESPRLLALAGGDLGRIDAPMVFAAAAQGDPAALRVAAKASQALGAAVAVLINLCNPELIVLAGGVMEAGEILLAPLRHWAEQYAFPAAFRQTRIHRSSLTKASGIRGATALFLYEERRSAPEIGR
jgi:glucokinase